MAAAFSSAPPFLRQAVMLAARKEWLRALVVRSREFAWRP